MKASIVSALALLSLFACSSTTTTTTADAGRPSCEMLAEHCHEATSDEGKKCHDLGHGDATEETCKAAAESCMKACEHVEQDASTEASLDAGPDTAACKAVGQECTASSECCSQDCHSHGGAKMCE